MEHLSMGNILGGLHCFSCVGRHMSFAKAAEELFITPSAVSHRIRHLESQLGFPLFNRFTRRIAFTPEGRSLYDSLRFSLAGLETEIRNIATRQMHGNLIVSCIPSFAGRWLVPRLVDFYDKHPGISLHIRCRNDLVDFETENVDMAVYYGAGSYPDLHISHLMPEELTPVCSPEYAEVHDLYGKPEHLVHCQLLHDSLPWPNAQFFSEWSTWAAWAGIEKLELRGGYSFDRSELAVDTARQGVGIAMGRMRLVHSLLEDGSLVAPFEGTCPSPHGYYLACTQERADSPRIQSFRQWLLETVDREEKEGRVTKLKN